MPAPEIQTPPEFQFYVQQHGISKNKREFERDSIPGLQKSLSKAHDNLAKQVGINTRIYAQLLTAHRRLDRDAIKIWVLTLLLGGEGALLLWLANLVMERLK